MVKRREGSQTPTLVPWTAHESIVSFAAKPADAHTAKNVLAVEARDQEVLFFVNGAQGASLPRDQLPTNGIVGFRVNHNLNLHITTLEVISPVP